MVRNWRGRWARLGQRPPRAIALGVRRELRAEVERFRAPLRARRFTARALLRHTGAPSLSALWQALGERPYLAVTTAEQVAGYDRLCPGDRARILAAAEAALEHRIDLLGTGPVHLGRVIDWHRDYRSGHTWPPAPIRAIDVLDPHRPSDVKIPWEISRLQWLIPAGQAWLLTGEERYAAAVREVLDSWITANPYARSVNWTCTMEAALRVLTWTWFFHIFRRSAAWEDPGFRLRFLRALYLHGDFTAHHIEYSDRNANHYLANAAGLVFAGLFFGSGRAPRAWQRRGWRMLRAELPLQVFPDGVDFEGSVPYHRLVLELFLLPALYREAAGEAVGAAYRERLASMARFVAAYSRPDGSTPLWGDGDDGRALPFGGQAITEHRYLPGLVGAAWEMPGLRQAAGGSRAEACWLLGSMRAAALPENPTAAPASAAFADGGFYTMRSELDHVFIDGGPVGMAGRGGHGHNDCLSFEAVLEGEHLITDCGSFVYTASYEERNRFRSTAFHNTPRIDGEEINRFVHPDLLWRLHADAVPEIRCWHTGAAESRFRGSHRGYRRLSSPVTPVRTIVLDHRRHWLVVEDAFEGEGVHTVEIPLHLAPGVAVREVTPGCAQLRAPRASFCLRWEAIGDWELSTEEGRVSPSYGVAVPIVRLLWRRTGALDSPLRVFLGPEGAEPADPMAWARAAAGGGIGRR